MFADAHISSLGHLCCVWKFVSLFVSSSQSPPDGTLWRAMKLSESAEKVYDMRFFLITL